jgi:hypothetical protein
MLLFIQEWETGEVMGARREESATGRITVTPRIHAMMRDFVRGLDAEYSEGIEFLLSRIIQPGEDPILAGRRLRDEYQKTKA